LREFCRATRAPWCARPTASCFPPLLCGFLRVEAR